MSVHMAFPGWEVLNWACLCKGAWVFTVSDLRLCNTPKTLLLPPWLGRSLCKPSLSRWVCGLWAPPAQTQPELLILVLTATGSGFLGDTLFSLSLVSFSLDLRWFHNSVTFIFSQVPLGCWTHSPKFPTGGIFREGRALVVASSLYSFAIMCKKSFIKYVSHKP